MRDAHTHVVSLERLKYYYCQCCLLLDRIERSTQNTALSDRENEARESSRNENKTHTIE